MAYTCSDKFLSTALFCTHYEIYNSFVTTFLPTFVIFCPGFLTLLVSHLLLSPALLYLRFLDI